MASKEVSEFVKSGLQKIFENTNPFILRRGMETKLKRIFQSRYTGSESSSEG